MGVHAEYLIGQVKELYTASLCHGFNQKYTKEAIQTQV